MPKWLKCTVSKGMFSDEFTVVIRTRNGDDVSVFVPKEAADHQAGRVKVRVDERDQTAIAVLPDENQSVVEVSASDLVPI